MDLRTALLACTASLFLGLAGGVFGCRYVQKKDALEAQIALDKARRESEQLKGEVNALQEQAGRHATAANQHRQENEAWGKEVAALKAKLAKLQASSVQPAQPSVSDAPLGDGGVGIPQPSNGALDPASALKDEIIAAQDKQIEGLKAEAFELRAALDTTGKALATSEQRARGLEIALDAQEHAATSGKWLGRLQGFAIGVGIGFAGGKL